MTDTFYPVPTTTGHGHAHAHAHTHVNNHTSLPNSFSAAPAQRYAAPTADTAQEDDGQISCICGYADDDGMTLSLIHI